jgi:predicted anti-sigma-YlaC factor YlaD
MSPGFDVPIIRIRGSGGGGVSSGRNKPIDGGVGWDVSAVNAAVFGAAAVIGLGVVVGWLHGSKMSQLALKIHSSQTAKALSNSKLR